MVSLAHQRTKVDLVSLQKWEKKAKSGGWVGGGEALCLDSGFVVQKRVGCVVGVWAVADRYLVYSRYMLWDWEGNSIIVVHRPS